VAYCISYLMALRFPRRDCTFGIDND
jgi:hypothetical protein